MGTETKDNFHTESSATRIHLTKTSTTKNAKCLNKALCSSGNFKEKQTPICEVSFVPVEVGESNVIEGAKQILLHIRPDWDLNLVRFKV